MGGDKEGTGPVPRAKFDDYGGPSWTDGHGVDDGKWGEIMDQMGWWNYGEFREI